MSMDKYMKVKKIGEGSFGKAYLVKAKEQPGKQFVIKEINMGKMGRKERDESRKEVTVLSQMQHPNIVTYRESFEEIGNLYIVMDYCDGGDLYSKINAQRGILFSEDQVLDWFVQICLSIKHIHDRKILHRDIKSQNVFLCKSGIVKLGDFGIAKVLNSTVELARTCIGTPYYLSPEICENKPYNNKSDVWSLGCVLYELTTLKHAFEAGNMKNLVLKIIRGSYPPVPPKYSYELRMIIAQLFKRNPRDRPSINTLLKKPFIQRRIQKFLSETELQSEFSHTIMHGHRAQKRLPLGPAPVAKPAVLNQARRLPAPTPAPAPAVKKYNPAAKYGPSVAAVRKSKESKDKENRRSNDSKKKPPPVGGVAAALAPNDDLAKRRQDLIDKEKQRREQQRKADYARQHRDLIERQRMARLQKAREEGWKNLVSSLGSNNDDEKISPRSPTDDEPPEAPRNIKPAPAVKPAGFVPLQDRGDYDKYHAYLDKIQQDQDDRMQAAASPTDMPKFETPVPKGIEAWPDRDAVKREISRVGEPAVNVAANAVREAKQKAGEAAERARLVEDFLSRKREAALNKQRGHAAMYGLPQPAASNDPTAQKRPWSAVGQDRNQDEQDYLGRLRQIRLQNFNERRQLKDRVQGDPRNDPEARRKKVEALRAQADARAQELKQQLEKKREDVFARQKKQWQEQMEKQAKPQQRAVPAHRVVSAPAHRAVAAAPAAGLTNVMRAIGVEEPQKQSVPQAALTPGMTNVLEAIGADMGKSSDPVSESVEKSPIQIKKDKILRKLNKAPGGDRPKWGAPVQPSFEPAVERPKWGDAQANLADFALEQTASNMEATSAADLVIKHPEGAQQPVRKQWGGPAGTALNVLQGAQLIDGTTMTVATENQPTENVAGVTMVVGKYPAIGKSTMVISDSDGKKPKSDDIADLEAESVEELKSDSKSNSPLKTSDVPTKPAVAPMSAWGESNTPEKSGRNSASPRPKTPKTTLSESPKKSASPVAESKPSPQRLFEKVQLDEDDDEDKTDAADWQLEEIEEDSNVPDVKCGSAGVMIGLTTGNFDVGDARMLRTCSLPDISKLFRTNLAENPFFEGDPISASIDVNYMVDNDDIDNEVDQNEDIDENEINDIVDADEEKEEDEESDGDAELEEEEIRTLRETMEKLLHEEKGTRKRKKKSRTLSGKSPAKTTTATDQLDGGLSKSPEKEASDPEVEWESDDDDEDNDTIFGDSEEDTFCRLEESRIELEQDLGCDVFMKVYKTVQALHEDEDESIEDGHKLVSGILGEAKSHLYKKILNLVMADGAYLEDND